MNLIYYFTGTGNTLYTAKKFAERLGNTKLISISFLDRSQDVVIPEDVETVGIFYPVFCFGIPTIVRKFVRRIQKPGHHVYFYGLCTSGGMKGFATSILQTMLNKQNIVLQAAFHIKMPSNYIPFSQPAGEHHCKMLYDAACAQIQKYAEIVKNRRRKKVFCPFPFNLIGQKIANSAVDYLSDYDKYFWLKENCNGCGLCEKICPASNIIIMNGMATFRGHCEQCMACLQWCPREAIQFRQVTLTRKRYHHPEISVEELMRKPLD